jgi:hypothetical protein
MRGKEMPFGSALRARGLQATEMAKAVTSAVNEPPSHVAAEKVEVLVEICLAGPEDIRQNRLALDKSLDARQALLDFIDGHLRLMDATWAWAQKLNQSGYTITGAMNLEAAIDNVRKVRVEIS